MIRFKIAHRCFAIYLLFLSLILLACTTNAVAQCGGNRLPSTAGYQTRSAEVHALMSRAPQKLLGMFVKHRGQDMQMTEADAISVTYAQPTDTGRDSYRNSDQKMLLIRGRLWMAILPAIVCSAAVVLMSLHLKKRLMVTVS
jgi:hypothetical protein